MSENLSDIQQVLQRLDKLERQNRSLKRGFAGLLFAGLAVCLVAAQAAAPKGKTLEAERFVIVDSDGKARATLGFDKPYPTSDDSRLGLYFYDEEKKPQLIMLPDEGKGGGLYFEENGNTRMGLVSRKDKIAGVVVYRRANDRKSQIGLFYSDDGKPGLFLNDNKGTTRLGMMLEEGGRPIMSMKDQDGKVFFSQGK